MVKQELVEQLQSGVVEIQFTKVNGELRTMKCTLNASYLPQQTDVEETASKSNQNTIAVWDLDKEAWRSFRVESVQSARQFLAE